MALNADEKLAFERFLAETDSRAWLLRAALTQLMKGRPRASEHARWLLGHIEERERAHLDGLAPGSRQRLEVFARRGSEGLEGPIEQGDLARSDLARSVMEVVDLLIWQKELRLMGPKIVKEPDDPIG